MSALPFDPTRVALYSPERRDTIFSAGKDYSDVQIGIEAARLAYFRAEQSPLEVQRLKSALALVGFDAPTLLQGTATDTRAFACYRSVDAMALIAFRGTRPDALQDLVTDAKFAFTEWPESGGRVHLGFAGAFRGIRTSIEHWLEENKIETGRLLLAGHSLGAALATLAASVWKPALLLTIGSPRVGNAKFVESLDSCNIVRLLSCCDLVTDVPFEMAGYRHAGIPLYVTAQGSVLADPAPAFMEKDRSQADRDYLKHYAWRSTKNVLSRRLADHAPINYSRAFF